MVFEEGVEGVYEGCTRAIILSYCPCSEVRCAIWEGNEGVERCVVGMIGWGGVGGGEGMDGRGRSVSIAPPVPISSAPEKEERNQARA